MRSAKRNRKRIYTVLAVSMMLLGGCGKMEKTPTPAEETKRTQECAEKTGEDSETGKEATDSGDRQEISEAASKPEESGTLQEEIAKEAVLQDPLQADSAKAGVDSVKKASRKVLPDGWELTLPTEDWGLSFGETGTQSRGNASAEDLAWYDAYYVGDDSEKVLYLTFDCGYENGNTEPILDALQKHNVQATFFVVGHFLETAPDLVKRMVEDGHAVGNHTYHHPDMSTISDQAAFQKEMDDVANLFQEITGKELSPFYRPPQGKCNVENLKQAQEMGYYTIFWSLAYVDWDQNSQPSHEEAFDKLTSRVHPGAVVLLHNTSQTNGEILDELLTKWEGMGYTYKSLAELVN